MRWNVGLTIQGCFGRDAVTPRILPVREREPAGRAVTTPPAGPLQSLALVDRENPLLQLQNRQVNASGEDGADVAARPRTGVLVLLLDDVDQCATISLSGPAT